MELRSPQFSFNDSEEVGFAATLDTTNSAGVPTRASMFGRQRAVSN